MCCEPVKVTIVFEVSGEYEHCTDMSPEDSLHEDLCLAIHEGDKEALERLHDYVYNIVHPDNQ